MLSPSSADNSANTSYVDAIHLGFRYLLARYPEVFAIGQGLWSPWYVGRSMRDLDKEFGRERIIDSPVSELACTGIALGASLFGYRPVVVHPRIDFMLLATDQIVTQAAKWSSMFGGTMHPRLTIRGIINRGGEQGAQHSQSLQSWFAHIPGLRVVMPYSAHDARDLLISSVLCDDPVLYIDDRWLYDVSEPLAEIIETPLPGQGPKLLRSGADITIVGIGFGTKLALDAAEALHRDGLEADVIDCRILNPFSPQLIVDSARRTRRLIVIDLDWRTCGFAGEILACVSEAASGESSIRMRRVTLPDASAPTSAPLERIYYPSAQQVIQQAKNLVS